MVFHFLRILMHFFKSHPHFLIFSSKFYCLLIPQRRSSPIGCRTIKNKNEWILVSIFDTNSFYWGSQDCNNFFSRYSIFSLIWKNIFILTPFLSHIYIFFFFSLSVLFSFNFYSPENAGMFCWGHYLFPWKPTCIKKKKIK